MEVVRLESPLTSDDPAIRVGLIWQPDVGKHLTTPKTIHGQRRERSELLEKNSDNDKVRSGNGLCRFVRASTARYH